MSVYSELIRVGINADAASELAEAATKSTGLVTKDDLRVAIAELESKLTRTILTALIGMTGIFAVFVGLMTAVIAWMITS